MRSEIPSCYKVIKLTVKEFWETFTEVEVSLTVSLVFAINLLNNIPLLNLDEGGVEVSCRAYKLWSQFICFVHISRFNSLSPDVEDRI